MPWKVAKVKESKEMEQWLFICPNIFAQTKNTAFVRKHMMFSCVVKEIHGISILIDWPRSTQCRKWRDAEPSLSLTVSPKLCVHREYVLAVAVLIEGMRRFMFNLALLLLIRDHKHTPRQLLLISPVIKSSRTLPLLDFLPGIHRLGWQVFFGSHEDERWEHLHHLLVLFERLRLGSSASIFISKAARLTLSWVEHLWCEL